MARLFSEDLIDNYNADSSFEWFGHSLYIRFLELIIIVAVLGILIALALPYYRVAMIKATVSEAFVMSAHGRLQAHEYYAVTGNWLNQEPVTGSEVNSDELSQVIEQGAVTVIFPQSKRLLIHGEKLTFRPMMQRSDQGMTIEWLCGYTRMSGHQLIGIDKTDIPAEHVPNICRR